MFSLFCCTLPLCRSILCRFIFLSNKLYTVGCYCFHASMTTNCKILVFLFTQLGACMVHVGDSQTRSRDIPFIPNFVLVRTSNRCIEVVEWYTPYYKIIRSTIAAAASLPQCPLFIFSLFDHFILSAHSEMPRI